MKVKFYAHVHKTHGKDLYAVFPDQIERQRGGKALSFSGYAHVGQHVPVSAGYIAESREATAKEYTPLLKELQGIYNDLQVLNT